MTKCSSLGGWRKSGFEFQKNCPCFWSFYSHFRSNRSFERSQFASNGSRHLYDKGCHKQATVIDYNRRFNRMNMSALNHNGATLAQSSCQHIRWQQQTCTMARQHHKPPSSQVTTSCIDTPRRSNTSFRTVNSRVSMKDSGVVFKKRKAANNQHSKFNDDLELWRSA